MNHTTTEASGVKRRTSRSPRWLFVPFVFLLGGASWLCLFYDCPAPDDAALSPPAFSAGNPLSLFLREFSYAEGNQPENAWPALRLMSHIGAVSSEDEEEVHQFMASQAKRFQAFEQLLQSDKSTWQWPPNPYEQEIPYDQLEWRSCLTLCRQLMLAEGDHDGAHEVCRKMVEFTHHTVNTASTSVLFHRSLDCYETACDETLSTLSSTPASRDNITQTLKHLEAHSGPTLKSALFLVQSEYQAFKQNLNVESSVRKTESPIDPFAPPPPVSERLGAHLVKPNRTCTLRLKWDLPLERALHIGWAEAYIASQARISIIKEFKTQLIQKSAWLDGNIGGKRLVARESENCHLGPIIKTLRHQNLVITQLALRLYQLDHGRPPKNLDQLMPAYIDSVPTDPLTKVPLFWDAESETLYSVNPVSSVRQDNLARPTLHTDDADAVYAWGSASTTVVQVQMREME